MKTAERVPLLGNLRFYILVFSVLLSVVIVAWYRLTIESDQLVAIRTQQTYGFISLAFWYVALIVSPLGRVIGRRRINRLEFARRAIGVSAFYFALLHALVALVGQLGGISQLQYLPELYLWSLGSGLVALIILSIMTATSFDRVVRFMTYKRWKLLHRLVYAAGIVALLHVWMIGTHLAYTAVQIIGFLAIIVLLWLEIYRLVVSWSQKTLKLEKDLVFVIALSVWSLVSVGVGMLPNVIDNYHSRHETHEVSP